jgi:hypothetical protein
MEAAVRSTTINKRNNKRYQPSLIITLWRGENFLVYVDIARLSNGWKFVRDHGRWGGGQ